MNNITDHDWEYKGVDGAVENDWYILPVVILFGIVAFIALIGADNFIEVMSDFIVGIRAN
jgi:hypothetical protein